MSESNGKLSELKGKPSPFTLKDGTQVMLRPITYGERTELIQWSDENKDAPNRNFVLQQKLVAFVMDESEDEVAKCLPEKIDEIATEAGARNGFYTRAGEKKAMPPDSSETPTSDLLVNTPLPAG